MPRQEKRRGATALVAVWIAAVGVGGCSTTPAPEPAKASPGAETAGDPAKPVDPAEQAREAVRRRTEAFLDGFRKRDYAAVWALYDDKLKEQGGSGEEFAKYMKKREARAGSLQQVLDVAERRIDEVTVQKDRAQAKVVLTVPGRGPEKHVFEWAYDEEAKEWFFTGGTGPGGAGSK